MVVTFKFWKRPSDVSSSARLRTSSFGARSLRTASCARAWGREGLFRTPRSRSGAAFRAARVTGFSGGNWGWVLGLAALPRRSRSVFRYAKYSLSLGRAHARSALFEAFGASPLGSRLRRDGRPFGPPCPRRFAPRSKSCLILANIFGGPLTRPSALRSAPLTGVVVITLAS